jgi:hypothetical protein
MMESGIQSNRSLTMDVRIVRHLFRLIIILHDEADLLGASRRKKCQRGRCEFRKINQRWIVEDGVRYSIET